MSEMASSVPGDYAPEITPSGPPRTHLGGPRD